MADNRPLTVIAASGLWGTVEIIVLQSGDCPAGAFFQGDCQRIREKGVDAPHATAQARFAVLFQQVANYGSSGVPPKRFKKEMGNLWDFRHEVSNRQIRFPCFRDGNAWIVTHGFVKPGAKSGLGEWPESEVSRAERIEAEYRERKKRVGSPPKKKR